MSIVGHVEELEEEEAGTGRPECRSMYWAHEDQRNELCKYRDGRRDGFSKNREDRDDGFVCSSKRKTCKREERTDGTTDVTRSNKFDVLNLTESGLKVDEVNAVDELQEVVEITDDTGAAKSVWPIQESATRTKATKMVRLAAASGSQIHVIGIPSGW